VFFSLVRNMACNTPSVKAATGAETMPAATVPAAATAAARAVVANRAAGTAAGAAFSGGIVANKPADRARPRQPGRRRLAGVGRSRVHGALGAAQQAGGLLVRLPLQVTKDEGHPAAGGQPQHRLVQRPAEVAPHHLLERVRGRRDRAPPFGGAA